MEYCPRRCSKIAFACFIALMSIPGIVQAVTGRLIVRLEGKLAGHAEEQGILRRRPAGAVVMAAGPGDEAGPVVDMGAFRRRKSG